MLLNVKAFFAMLFATFFCIRNSVSACLVPVSQNQTCVTVTLYDQFYDGWDGAMWYIETPKTPIAPAAPNCSHNPVIKHICGENGQYYMMVLNDDDEAPDFWWEIVWTVCLDCTGQCYTGGYNTTMVFDYSNSEWTLIHQHNLLPNTMEYQTCGASEYFASEECLPEPEQDTQNAPARHTPEKKMKATEAPVSSRIVGRQKGRGLVATSNKKNNVKAQSPTRQPKDKKRTIDLPDAPAIPDTDTPTVVPSALPTSPIPTVTPTVVPTVFPTPTNQTRWPTSMPTGQPSDQPTDQPTGLPTSSPSLFQSLPVHQIRQKERVQKQKVVVVRKEKNGGGEEPTPEPTYSPTPEPTVVPTVLPTVFPTPTNQTRWPTSMPTGQPSDQPTSQPTGYPTEEEKAEGEGNPPTLGLFGNTKQMKQKQKKTIVVDRPEMHRGGGGEEPTPEPTYSPTPEPTVVPTVLPTVFPTPTNQTRWPTGMPTSQPTGYPTYEAEEEIEGGGNPPTLGLFGNTKQIKNNRQKRVIDRPEIHRGGGGEEPTPEPTYSPTPEPTVVPTVLPTVFPTPTNQTRWPTGMPTSQPTGYPTEEEEAEIGGNPPTNEINKNIMKKQRQKKEIDKPDLPENSKPAPTAMPTLFPTPYPTVVPTVLPTVFPTPTNQTRWPTSIPTGQPSDQPTGQPTSEPTAIEHGSPPTIKKPEKKEKLKFERSVEKAKPVKPIESNCPVELKVTMYSPNGEGWYESNYEGTMFYIASESKKELITYGMIGKETYIGYCEYCFGEGSYYFRVTDDKYYHDARWSFCGTTGSFSEQLSFHIENCECVPDVLLDKEMVCEDTYSSVVTLHGKLVLDGIQTDIFSKKDQYVVAEALAAVVSGWEADNINVHSTGVVMRQPNDKGRSKSRSVEFEVSFVPEIAFDYDGMSYSGIEELVEELAILLQDSMSTGEFVSALRAYAADMGNRQMAGVDNAEALELMLEDVTYVGTKTITMAEDDSERMSTTSVNIFATAQHVTYSQYYHGLIFGVTLSVGVLVFIGALGHSLRARRYEDLISKFVDPAESDLTASNHVLSEGKSRYSSPVSL